MTDKKIVFDVVGRDQASATFEHVGKAAQSTESKFKSFGRTSSSASKETHGFGSTLGKLAGAFAGLAIAQKATEFIKGSIEAASEDQASQRKLAVALHNTTGATNEQVTAVGEWLTQQSLATGVSKDELMPAFQRLAESTGSVTKAQREMKIAMDVSAGTGKSLSTVSAALMKANNGTTSSLSRLGLKTKDAAGNTLTLNQALHTMSDTFKGQAQAKAQSFDGTMQRLHTTFHEVEVKVGTALIPILQTVANWFLTKGLPAAEAFSQNLKQELVPVFDRVRSAIDAMMPTVRTVIDFLKKNPATVKAFAITLTVLSVAIGVVSAAMSALDAVLAANPFVLAAVALAVLVAGFVYAYKHSEKFRAVVQGSLHAVEAAAKGFVALFHALWQTWGNNIEAVAKNIWRAVSGVIKGYMTEIRGVIKVITSLIHGDWAGVWQGIKMIVSGAWQVIKSEVRLGGQAVVGLVKNIPGMLANLGGLFLNAGKGLIHALFNGILSAAKAGAGFVASLVGDIKSAINNALGLPLQINFDKGPIHIHATVIPAFASGVQNFSGGMALVGEQGPEIVSLPRHSNVYPNGTGPGGGGDIHVTINGALDPIAVGQQVQQILLKLKRTQGGGELGIA